MKDRLVEHIEGEGYPTEAIVEFKEATREKEAVSTDNVTGSEEEFVVMDRIKVTEEKFVLIAEGKRSSTGEGIIQCLLAMKDAWVNNDWWMYRYDGTSFVMTEKLKVLFETMEKDKKRWIDNYSVVVNYL
ncbi:hypothetical protein EV426DRAFT_572902 [Tirmania nivea]|nr:hypothetical protein EV426DRAFT_572902 [Tirmania nivea]